MSRPRVEIRAFTCRRDVAPAALLARLLERKGCDVMITCVRDFMRTLELWKPEVAVFSTPGKAVAIKAASPGTSTAFLDGEGFQPADGSRGLWWSRNPEQFRATDLALVWGRRVLDEVREARPEADLANVHVVGNPSYDLVRFLPESVAHDPAAPTVGVVARFHTINDQLGISPVRTLPNPGNLERVIVQCQAFVGVVSCVRALLEKTPFTVSIRPHPLEQVESYHASKSLWFGEHAARVEIDDSLAFADWAVRQRALISPTSTTLIEAYLLGVAVINTDAVAGTEQFNREYAEVAAAWQSAGAAPRDLGHLADLVTTPRRAAADPAIEHQLDGYCDFGDPRPACLRAAEHIAALAHATPRPRGMRWPAWAVDAADGLAFRRAMGRNPLHANMNYRRGYHRLPEHLDAIERNILAGAPPRRRAGALDLTPAGAAQ